MKNNRTIRCAIVDDNRDTLYNLKKMFSFDEDIEICMICASASDFFDQMERSPKNDQPVVVFTDIDMPEMDGITMVLLGKVRYPDVKYLMLTIHDDEHFLFDAIKAGASGYLLKDDSSTHISSQVKTLIYNNGAPMSPIIAKRTLQFIQQSTVTTQEAKSHYVPPLSAREMEVLKLMTDGFTYRQIGACLFISPNTVKRHISNIYEKLHISSKAEAIKLVVKYRLFNEPL